MFCEGLKIVGGRAEFHPGGEKPQVLRLAIGFPDGSQDLFPTGPVDRRLQRPAVVDHPFFHHQEEILVRLGEQGDVVEGISLDDKQIGNDSGGEDA